VDIGSHEQHRLRSATCKAVRHAGAVRVEHRRADASTAPLGVAGGSDEYDNDEAVRSSNAGPCNPAIRLRSIFVADEVAHANRGHVRAIVIARNPWTVARRVLAHSTSGANVVSKNRYRVLRVVDDVRDLVRKSRD
jgi:hypothetical protein